MNDNPLDLIRYHHHAQLQDATLLLAFSGWMDGGDVSTGTVRRLVTVLNATPLAEIDPDPFYIQNVPGPMEIAALFRPHIEYEDGLIKQIQMPENQFSVDVTSNLVLFVGKDRGGPNITLQRCSQPICHQCCHGFLNCTTTRIIDLRLRIDYLQEIPGEKAN